MRLVCTSLLQAKAGTLVLLHGANVHFSHENTSPNSRHAYRCTPCIILNQIMASRMH
jgi:Phytanoyl-CoA dioxygenase (PhyH)